MGGRKLERHASLRKKRAPAAFRASLPSILSLQTFLRCEAPPTRPCFPSTSFLSYQYDGVGQNISANRTVQVFLVKGPRRGSSLRDRASASVDRRKG
jgi:hypothetical protein